MSVIDLITRVDAICKKYDKYDVDKHRESDNVSGDDAFARLYGAVEANVDTALQVSHCFPLFTWLLGLWVLVFSWFCYVFFRLSMRKSLFVWREKKRQRGGNKRKMIGTFFFLEFSVISLVQLLVFLSVWLLKKLEEESLNICLVLLFLFSYSIAKKVIEMVILRLRK